jgi:hypothetical protein
MPQLPLKTRRLLARGVSRRAEPALRRRTFLGTGERGVRTLGPLTVLSRTYTGTQPSFGIVVGGNNTAFNLGVSGSTITVTAATDGSGNATTTYKQVADAIQTSPAASALVWPSLTDAGATVVAASAVSALTP